MQYFTHHCNQISDKKKLKGGREGFLLAHSFRGYSLSMAERDGSRNKWSSWSHCIHNYKVEHRQEEWGQAIKPVATSSSKVPPPKLQPSKTISAVWGPSAWTKWHFILKPQWSAPRRQGYLFASFTGGFISTSHMGGLYNCKVNAWWGWEDVLFLNWSFRILLNLRFLLPFHRYETWGSQKVKFCWRPCS